MSSYSGKSPLCAASWGARRAEAMKLLINDLAPEKNKKMTKNQHDRRVATKQLEELPTGMSTDEDILSDVRTRSHEAFDIARNPFVLRSVQRQWQKSQGLSVEELRQLGGNKMKKGQKCIHQGGSQAMAKLNFNKTNVLIQIITTFLDVIVKL